MSGEEDPIEALFTKLHQKQAEIQEKYKCSTAHILRAIIDPKDVALLANIVASIEAPTEETTKIAQSVEKHVTKKKKSIMNNYGMFLIY